MKAIPFFAAGPSVWPFLDRAISPPVAKQACRVACVVGPLLTLINQWDALFGPVAFSFGKAALSVLVPYCVATYSAVRMDMLRSSLDRD